MGIAGQHIKSFQNDGSLMRESFNEEISINDVEKLIDSMYNVAVEAGYKIIDVIPQEYNVDNETGIKEPVGMFGRNLKASFHTITGQISAIKNLHRCVERSGLKVNNLMLEPIASAEAVLSEEEKEAGVALVDIGGGTTDIAIFQDGIIRHTSVIPFGGNVITEDIRQGCTILKEQAEILKIRYGSAIASENKETEIVTIPGLKGREPKEISLRNLANIIQARMEEILKFVYLDIKNSGFSKKLIAGIVLTGGGAQMKHIQQLTELITSMETRIGYPTEHLALTENKDITSPMYSTGVGLVLKGFEEMEKKETNKEKSKEETKTDKESNKPKKTDKLKKWFDDLIKDIN